MLFSLQGKFHIGERLVTGKPGAMYWVGNAPEATIALQLQSETINESFSGKRLPYGTIDQSQSGTLNLTLQEWFLKNLALGLHATELDHTPVAVTDEAFPSGLAVGDQIKLEHPFVTSPAGVALTDSAGPPAPLTAGTHFRLSGHNRQIVEILDLAAFTQPFHAAYAYEAYTTLDAFADSPPERYVVFDGIDTVSGNGVIIDLYRVKFSPIANLGMITAGAGALPMVGQILYDELNAGADGKGGFFRIRQKTAA